MEVKTLVGLILAAIALSSLITIVIKMKEPVEQGSNIQAVKNWVLLAGTFAEETSITKGVSDRPPVTKLYGPIEIDSESDFKRQSITKPPRVHKVIADAMVDCWGAFDRGQTNFLTVLDSKHFCFPCTGIQFSENIKKSHPIIVGMHEFLKDSSNKIGSGKSPTYQEYLTNGNINYPTEELISNQLPTENDLYVYFVAGNGDWWEKVKKLPWWAFVGTGALVVGTGGLAIAGAGAIAVAVGVGASVGAAGGAAGVALFDDKEFQPKIVVGPPEVIIKACSTPDEQQIQHNAAASEDPIKKIDLKK